MPLSPSPIPTILLVFITVEASAWPSTHLHGHSSLRASTSLKSIALSGLRATRYHPYLNLTRNPCLCRYMQVRVICDAVDVATPIPNQMAGGVLLPKSHGGTDKMLKTTNEDQRTKDQCAMTCEQSQPHRCLWVFGRSADCSPHPYPRTWTSNGALTSNMTRAVDVAADQGS